MNSRQKLRIMHVLKSSVYSGAENVVITIIRSLSEQFDFIYVATDGPIREVLERENIPFQLLPAFDRKNLCGAIAARHPDIVHAHDFSATVLCASIRGGFRLISQLHYDPPWVRKWNVKTIMYRLCRPKIDRVLTVSGKSFENMVFAPCYREKMTVVGNPIDSDRIQRLAREIPPELGDGTCDLIFVGRLVEQKNPQQFIRLVSALKTRMPDIKAWMLGSGELDHDCEALIEELGLERNVELKGFCSNPYPYISRARLLCMTSRWEGFGLVLLEANILGIPVLSTRTAGAEEVLGENAAELCGGEGEMGEKANDILRNANICEVFAEKARMRAEAISTIEDYMNNIKRIYEEEAK